MPSQSDKGDERRVSELSLDELEALVVERRRIERARAFAESDDTRRFSPITVQPGQEKRESGVSTVGAITCCFW